MNAQKAWKLHLKISFLSFSVKFICLWLTTHQPAINVLKEVQLYLQKNPNEMVTIFIEDHVIISPTGRVSQVFDAAGLRKFWFPASQMPKKVEIGQQLILWSRKISAYLCSLQTLLRRHLKGLPISKISLQKTNVSPTFFSFCEISVG